jgi:hypothetical protein
VGELTQSQVGRRRDAMVSLPFRTAGSRILAGAWLDFAGDRIAPARRDIDPARLVKVLPNIVILQYAEPETIRFRLAGTDFFTTFDREMTGQSYLELIPPDQREATRQRLFTIVRHPCGLLAVLGKEGSERDRDRLESFGLPLRNEAGEIEYTIHHADYLEPVRDIERISMDRIRAINAAWVDIGRGVPGQPAPL